MKILLAIDGSKFSDAAIDKLIAQVRSDGTEVSVLHVMDPMPVYMDLQKWGTFPNYEALRQEQQKEAEALVARAAEKLRAIGFSVTTAVEEGDPKVVIIDSAARWHADLIVLGSHGRTGLDRFFLGSVSEAVGRHAKCSVQIVRVSVK